MKRRVRRLVRSVWRFPLCCYLRARLNNHSFCLISANCIGGYLSHDLGEAFRSPTVNLILSDYLKFVSNLPYYLNLPVCGKGTDVHGWPVASIGDIDILGVHYKNEEELLNAWRRRSERVDMGNIFLMATDQFINTQQQIEQFAKLPYPKVLFTVNKNLKHDFAVYIPGAPERTHAGDCLEYADIFGTRAFQKYFDCVAWLNKHPGANINQEVQK